MSITWTLPRWRRTSPVSSARMSSQWDAVIDFRNGTLNAHGKVGELVAWKSGHPCVDLLQFPEVHVVHTSTQADKDELADETFSAEGEDMELDAEDSVLSEPNESEGSLVEVASSGSEGETTSHAHTSEEEIESRSSSDEWGFCQSCFG